MAKQVEGTIHGLTVIPADVDNDEREETNEEKMARKVIENLRRNQPKAAMSYAVELVQEIAKNYRVSGGAWL